MIFSTSEIIGRDPVIFTVPGDRYSIKIAVQILNQLEQDPDCKIYDDSWNSSYGNLIENGITVRLGTIKFEIMCSYEHLFLRRISGNKGEFYRFCESIKDMDFDR